ncbi:MAG: hypothetical protein ACRDZ4_04050 [Egibacteraceae bacterium]
MTGRSARAEVSAVLGDGVERTVMGSAVFGSDPVQARCFQPCRQPVRLVGGGPERWRPAGLPVLVRCETLSCPRRLDGGPLSKDWLQRELERLCEAAEAVELSSGGTAHRLAGCASWD